jgi:hypothetical protein
MRPEHFLALAIALMAGPVASGASAPPEAAPAGAAKSEVKADGVTADRAFAQLCQSQPCRHDVDFTVRRTDGSERHVHEALFPPAVQSGVVTILPGETVEMVAEFHEGKFAGWRAPRSDDGPSAHRISVNLQQNRDDAGFMATVENHGPSLLKFQMGLHRLDGADDPEYTSSCPVGPGQTSFESWPYPLFQILITGVAVIEPSHQVACE